MCGTEAEHSPAPVCLGSSERYLGRGSRSPPHPRAWVPAAGSEAAGAAPLHGLMTVAPLGDFSVSLGTAAIIRGQHGNLRPSELQGRAPPPYGSDRGVKLFCVFFLFFLSSLFLSAPFQGWDLLLPPP